MVKDFSVVSEAHVFWNSLAYSMIQQILETSSREVSENTRPPYLPSEKLVCSQEATVKTSHGTMDWFQIGKGVQSCILSSCLFNLYAEYILQNAGLDEAQADIKIARRNINNLNYAFDTTLMAESKEALKSLLLKLKKESEKFGLKLHIRKLKSWHLVPSLHGK